MCELILRLVIGVFLVTSVTALFLAVSWKPWRGRGSGPVPMWGGALGIGIGYCLAHGYLVGWPSVPPVSGQQWLFVVALVAALAGAAHTVVDGHRSVRFILWFVLAVAVPVLALQSKLGQSWALAEAIPALTLLAALLFVWLISAEERTDHIEGASVPLNLAITTLGASLALGLSSSASLAELAGMLTAGISLYILAAWRWQFIVLSGGGVPLVGAMLAALLINGYFFAELPALSGLLIFLAPDAARLRRFGPLAKLTGWKRTLVRAALVAVPVAIAVGIALAGFLDSGGAAGGANPHADYY